MDMQQFEHRLCAKFVDAIRRTGRALIIPDEPEDIRVVDTPHDCVCEENGMRINIELTEAAIPHVSIVETQRQQYLEKIKTEIVSLAPQLAGLYIQLSLHCGPHRLPKPSTTCGRKLIASYSNTLKNSLVDLHDLPLNRLFAKRWLLKEYPCEYLAYRFAPAASGYGVIVRSDGGISTLNGEVEGSLPRAIEHKIDKLYAKPESARLWLVVYHIHVAIAYDDQKTYDQSRELLERSDHPFDEVWYFYPLARGAHGCCPVQIWPRPSAKVR